MLAHAYENNQELIKQIIFGKEQKNKCFSAAFDKKPLLKRIKEHLILQEK